MGCGPSSVVVMETNDATKEVEKQLAAAQEAENNLFKVLLLGAGESGKSTVVKQIKLIWKGGIPDKEREEYATNIHRNTIETMQTLVDAVSTLKLDWGESEPAMAEAAAELKDERADTPLSPELAAKIQALWASPTITRAFERRDEFWILDGAPFYFQNAARFAEAGYSPTEEDMLMTRVRTTGIVVTEFVQGPYTYNIVDVGGQRSERRKWINCFDNVKAIVFLVGLSGYHQVMFEDQNMKRMREDLALFDEVTKNKIFAKTPIFVFLNKKDMFETMIRKTDLNVCFPEYTGGCNVMPALDFIKAQFEAIMARNCPKKEMWQFVIAARVRMDMKMAFGEVKDQIIKIYKGQPR